VRAGTILWLAAALWVAALARDGWDRFIDATELPAAALTGPATSPEMLARDGRLLRAWTVEDGRWRLAVDIEDVDPMWRAMLLAWEDRRFDTHAGIDPAAFVRAGWQALRQGRIVSGGSTISMQVARLLEDSGTGRIQGKLRQMRVALALERRLDKRAILNLHLRLAPYGGNLEGLRAASLSWFGREPARLTPAQAALLVVLPQAPELRRPDLHPEAARAARDRVLARAAQTGLISEDEARAARTEPLPRMRLPFPRLAPHLGDRLRRDAPHLARHLTTIDADLQARMESLAVTALRGQDSRTGIAILAADHLTGEILANVGSARHENDHRQGHVDMTRAIRSPGSTLKPLVYALAFDDGLAHPATLVDDRPTIFGRYAPQNFDRRFRGTLTMREALRLSLNIPVISLTEALGPERLLSAMRRAGMRPQLPRNEAPGLAMALGGVGVSLQDLVTLYAGLARGGLARTLASRPDDTVPPRASRLVSEVAAWQVGDILAGITPPDGSPAGRIAWKTGTSYGHRDAWSIGWDGRWTVGVWMGRADGTPVPGAFGADHAAPVMFETFARIRPEAIPLPPAPPATLTLDTARLPVPLQRFRPRGTLIDPQLSPLISHPPEGAEIALEAGQPLMARVQGGTAPFTWLVDGAPLRIGDSTREVMLPMTRPGPVVLSVIDASGRGSRVRLSLAR